ncbi:hypothetical protein EH165_13500 [Nakamurella antarctica]|uniref:Cobalt transporter subunit (CbtA) n=1 Tax=Nakamurella antarctica TaxID=1902245 RepID=A0A3G8ZZN7_9ACTN|nr:CbtA family protein [Nakamurella antarctica]AZI59011.1 hypothetical protein EH165_13500 [Nakamurella antarctica]
MNATNVLSARNFLIRGLLAGFIAGILSFGVAYLVGEPSVDAAIAIEEAGSTTDAAPAPAAQHADSDHHDGSEAAAGHSHGEEAVVSRATQSTWGLLTATVLFGTALGGIVALAAAFAAGRVGRLLPRASTLVVGAVGFVAVYLVPYLKYPPNPPAVGNPDTIGPRTSQYFIMLAVSIVAAVVAMAIVRKIAAHLGGFNAALIGIAGFAAVTLVTAKLLPVIDEVPASFPGDLLWSFRLGSITVQATLWLSLTVILAVLVHSMTQPRDVALPPSRPVASL